MLSLASISALLSRIMKPLRTLAAIALGHQVLVHKCSGCNHVLDRARHLQEEPNLTAHHNPIGYDLAIWGRGGAAPSDLKTVNFEDLTTWSKASIDWL